MIETVDIEVVSVNVSLEKGTIKLPVNSIEITEKGIVEDAHSGSWHRMLSLLGVESFERLSKLANRNIAYGEFAENITTKGLELFTCKPLDRFVNEHVALEVTQIGKECHGNSCAIYREVGNCVMPKEGIFARVLKSGSMKSGDVLQYIPKVFRIKLITLSDRASMGQYDDRSGNRIKEWLHEYFDQYKYPIIIDYSLIADDAAMLRNELNNAVENIYDFVFTCGGTGIGPRDITVDVVSKLIDKEIPGIMDQIRLKYGENNPNALLSRSIAGVMKNTIVYTLPGSVKATNEYMTEIVKTMLHLVYMMHAIDAH